MTESPNVLDFNKLSPAEQVRAARHMRLSDILAVTGSTTGAERLLKTLGMSDAEIGKQLRANGLPPVPDTAVRFGEVLAARSAARRYRSEAHAHAVAEEAERRRQTEEQMEAAAHEFKNAHTFDGKVHAAENFFAHGAGLDDAVRHGMIREEDKKRIEATDTKAKQKAKEHCDKLEAEKRAEFEAKGIKGKQQEEALRKWREEEERRIRAEEQKKLAEQAKREGNIDLAAVAEVNASAIARYGMSIDERAAAGNLDNASIKTAKIGQEAKALEERRLRGETRSTDAIEEKGLRYLAKMATGSSSALPFTQDDKSALVKEYIKAEGSNTMKAATAMALKNGVITEGEVIDAKVNENRGAIESATVALAAANIGFGDDEPSVLNQLAKRKEAAATLGSAASPSTPKMA